MLHRHGADLNASWHHYRPLHALIQEEPHAVSEATTERLDCLDWLLNHGADPNLHAAWPSARAIIVAAFAGQPQYVIRLRKTVDAGDGFAAAALGDRAGVERALRERPGFAQERDGGGLTALACATGSRMPGIGAVEIARMLIDAGADVRAKTKSWSHDIDAAYLAAGAPDKALFVLLLDHGADATEALSHAVWGKHYEHAEEALAHGANLDGATSNGKPLLNDLVRWGQVPQTLWILAHGASPNIQDADGWTALHQAASRGNARLMEAVLAAGGDLSVQDHKGHTPNQIAEMAQHARLARLLRP